MLMSIGNSCMRRTTALSVYASGWQQQPSAAVCLAAHLLLLRVLQA